MASPTNFNLSPYFDDYTESKKFHRILFRPAFAVQARELTQSQSILQNQIERVSDHLFDKGAMVIPGEIGFDLDYSAIKLTSKTASSVTDYVGSTLTGGTSGITAKVVNAVATDGTDPDTLFVKYLTNDTTNNTQVAFTDGETITSTATGTPTAVVATTHTGSAAFIAAGVYYINGFQVSVDAQTLILDKYSNTPSYRVGLTVTESFVTSNDDATLVDNAQGSSNLNAPGAHRFKIDLTLAKKTISSTEDQNFVELMRLSNGLLQNQVRTTEYAVLEDTLARRTFDESGDYTVRDFDLDLREHLISGNNRGVYSSANGGSETKVAAGLSPGKAYVKGYEIETIGTKFLDVNKARSFDTQNAFNTRFDVGNFVNVTNVYGSPDVGFVSGDVEAFKKVNLFSAATSSPGTQNTGTASSSNAIGRAKSKGFQYVSGTATNSIFGSSSIYKHYLFDINLFTHLNITTAEDFTIASTASTAGEQYVIVTTGTSNFTSIGASSNAVGVIFTATGAGSGSGTLRPLGEKVTGGTSGATGTIELDSTSESVNITGVSIASPAVITTGGHNFKEGQQVTITGATGLTLADSSVVSTQVFTVRNPDATTFELYDTDGTTAVEVIAYTSGGTAAHGVCMLSNVKGVFVPGETITSSTSSDTAVIQANAVGFNAVNTFDFTSVKQIGMAGSPTYTSDTVTTNSTYANRLNLTGNISITASGAAVVGSGTLFTSELRVGDSISFDDTAGTTTTRIVEAIISDTSLTLSAVIGGTAVSSAIATRNRAKLQDANKNISIFKLPYDNIKTLKTASNSGLTDTSYTFTKHETATLSSNGDTTLTAGTNETFVGLNQAKYTVTIMTTGSGGTGSVGDVLSLSGNNHEGDPIFTLGGSPTGKQLTLDFGANFDGHKVKILVTVDKTSADSKSKTLTTATPVAVTDQNEIQRGTIRIPHADVFELTSVHMAADFNTTATTSDTDITSRFDLDTGQRDNFYDVGRIVLKSGQLAPTGQILISYKFFSHGTGDYFDVDSYSGAVTYENIPSYTSDTTGEKYELRDVLDFRPRVDNASTVNSGTQDRSFDGAGASTVNVIDFNSSVITDFEFYLPRIDKIFLDKEGNFKVVEGASALIPQVPKDLDGAMHLYTLSIPAYTLSPENIEIKKIDNRRYTMRDIGKLENRIENVEYYTQLSLLEANAQNLQIQDSEGFDRFKNGFIVDNFTGHSIGDVTNKDYKASMNMADGELRPMFNEDSIQLIERDNDGTAIIASDRTTAKYQKTGDIITLPYTESTLIDQPFASKTVNVNPFAVFTWSGNVELDPPGDEWKETERAPELVINNVGAFDTLAAGLGNSALNGFEIGTVWNEWQDFWTGQPNTTSRDISGNQRQGRRIFRRTEVTTQTTVNQTRTGVRQRVVPQVVRNSIGDRIVNVAFVPFIRSRTVTFTATRLKPNTRVYPFFDNIDVTAYVTPIDVNPSNGNETTGSLGGSIISNSNGTVKGTFAIPDPSNSSNPRWRTGERVFRLTSSSTNDTSSDVTTSAEADYTARGLLETVQNTIISTREPRIVRTSTTEDRSVVRASTRESTRTIGWHDPLAQTFLIDDEGGVFLTSMDLFFKTKDANVPVTLQIREVVNGYPGSKILPFSEVTLNPSSVNVSDDASTATTFNFSGPIYIQQNVEYCFVVLANSNDYTAYVARLGETNIGSDRTISQQPYTGVFFKSQNGSTWTADQNEDMKFRIKRAEFENVTGVLTLSNDTLPSRTLKTNAFRTTSGSGVVRVFHPNHGMHGTNNNVTIAGFPTSGINGLDHTEINTTHTSISNVTLDSYDITVSTTASATGDVGGTAATATQNRLADVLNLNLQSLTVPGTNASYSIRTTTGRSIGGSETEFTLTPETSAQSVIANDNIYFTAPTMIASEINETNEVGNKSLFVNVSLSTTNTKLSPVIDLQRASAIAVQNRLNNPQSGDPDFVDDTASTGTSSSAVYCTRSVALENASTALDVRLTSNVRSTSEVEVYFRLSGPDISERIEDLSWTPFNTAGEEDTTVTPAEDDETFKEYKYSASDLTEFTAFQIKIVMKGTNSSYPPVIRDMRGIALAV
tara:strand:+ start:1789 stop:8022 length:6234 start_codon:yes stop_codon:yes gene_type:complete